MWFDISICVLTLVANLKVEDVRCCCRGFVAPYVVWSDYTCCLSSLIALFLPQQGDKKKKTVVIKGDVSQLDSVGGMLKPSRNTVLVL